METLGILVLLSCVLLYVNTLENRRLFAWACYAAALAWVAGIFVQVAIHAWLYGPGQGCLSGFNAGVILGLFFTLPVPVTWIGLGAGSRTDCPLRGAIIGFALAFLIQAAILAGYQ